VRWRVKRAASRIPRLHHQVQGVGREAAQAAPALAVGAALLDGVGQQPGQAAVLC